MKTILQRFPFTLTMLVLLCIIGILTNTHTEALSADWLNRLGFAPLDLLALDLGRLFTSALVTNGGWIFWEALGMVAFSVGLAEWCTGTHRTALTFWGVHLSTLVLESLVIALPMHWVGITIGSLVSLSRDVGPSAGYFGTLGLVSTHLKYPWNLVSGGLIFLGLQVALLIVSGRINLGMNLSANLAHLIAFPLGWYSIRLVSKNDQNATGQTQ